MSDLDIIIEQLQGARRDLKALNDKPCRCDSYAFPHRVNGGRCSGEASQEHGTVSYHHTRQAMIDAGHHERDFL